MRIFPFDQPSAGPRNATQATIIGDWQRTGNDGPAPVAVKRRMASCQVRHWCRLVVAINMKIARTLGIAIPPVQLARATEVIERPTAEQLQIETLD